MENTKDDRAAMKEKMKEKGAIAKEKMAVKGEAAKEKMKDVKSKLTNKINSFFFSLYFLKLALTVFPPWAISSFFAEELINS